jgi:hypothetical protein
MQMRTGANYLKLAGALAAGGAFASLAASFAVPQCYVSSAVVRINPRQLEFAKQQMLSRGHLSFLMQRRDLNLYREERARMPMEDIVMQMRQHDIQIRPLPNSGGAPTAAEISFAYPDRQKSRAVVQALVSRFVEQGSVVNRWRADIWRTAWQSEAPPLPDDKVEVLIPPTVSEKAAGPNRLVFVAWGVGAGLLLGLIVASTLRRPAWTLQLGAFAVAGCAAAFAASYLIEERYTSATVMRFTEPMAPKYLADAAMSTPVQRMKRLEQKVLTSESLESLIGLPPLKLYPSLPINEATQKMRRDITIATASDSSFRIAFFYPDKQKAQGVVRELMSAFLYANNAEGEALMARGGEFRKMEEHKLGVNLEVLDPASPGIPVAPNRAAFGAAGLGLGLVLGTLSVRRRS